jgi:hypothetical protein
VTEPDAISLTYTPTLDDWERTLAVWQAASGARRRQAVMGWIILSLSGLSLGLHLVTASEDAEPLSPVGLIVPLVLAALGILVLVDAPGRWARQRFFTRNPATMLPTSATASSESLFVGTALTSGSSQWDYWATYLLLDDSIVLATGERTTAAWVLLPRRGLHDPSRWDDLVALVDSRVRLHPKSPQSPLTGG